VRFDGLTSNANTVNFGAERKCSVSRELSKKFEENKHGTLQEVHDYFNAKAVKGEIVIVVEGGGSK
jgi:16S rRNA (cytidine1402-2'-O)-methyltransferase